MYVCMIQLSNAFVELLCVYDIFDAVESWCMCAEKHVLGRNSVVIVQLVQVIGKKSTLMFDCRIDIGN